MSCTIRRRVRGRVTPVLACMTLLIAACDMDGMTMGDMAEISVAAEAQLATLPPEPVGWVGYRIEKPDGEGETYSWGPAFLFADNEARTLMIDGSETTIEPGEAVFVREGTEHTVADGSFWAFVLTDPETSPAPGLEQGAHELSSGPLEDVPDGPVELRFLIVDLPPEDGQTTVHTHPGPEFIHVVDGEIEYESGLQETTVLTAGDGSALPAETPVQKRNVSPEPARFWSWFIVDPDEPFSSEAAFPREGETS